MVDARAGGGRLVAVKCGGEARGEMRGWPNAPTERQDAKDV